MYYLLESNIQMKKTSGALSSPNSHSYAKGNILLDSSFTEGSKGTEF